MMQLSDLEPAIAPELLECLADVGINTAEELLLPANNISETAHLRTIFMRLPSGIAEFEDLLNVAESASAALARSMRGVSALELLRAHEATIASHSKNEFATGLAELDDMTGKFQGGRVLEIAGTPSLGKTALAMFIALRHLIRHENTIVMWLDTSQDAHFSRKLQAARSAALSSVSPDEAMGNDTAMDRLQIAKTADAKAASTALNGIARVLAAQETAHRTRPDSHVLRTRMIVVDSIADLFVPELKDKSGQGHVKMSAFMSRLRDISRKYHLSILVLNGSARISPPGEPPGQLPASRFVGNHRPALGATFTFLTDTTLWLTRYHGQLGDLRTASGLEVSQQQLVMAEVLRARHESSGRWCALCIRADGVIEPVEPGGL